MATRIEWRGIDEIERNLDVYKKKVHEACLSVANYFAPILEAEAKSNAPWTDRTGNARQGLRGFAQDVSETVVELYLSGKVGYQIYLELKNSGRYAIIMPTIEAHYKPIFDMLQKVLK